MRLLPLLLLVLVGTCARAQTCYTETPTDFKPYTPQQLAAAKANTDTLLPTVYYEVDYDIVQEFGGVGPAEAFIRGAFEEVAAVYRRDVTTDPQLILYIHDQPSGYVATSSFESLQEFRAARPNHPGNVAQLGSYRASGGIAYVDQVCKNLNYSFSSLRPEYESHDIYSWTVNVIGHELGHLFGSLHTQACAWNGDYTPIDGCVPPEGTCARPPLPQRGSMMSYCHIVSAVTNDLRILPQPAAVMRASMIASGCVASKPAGPVVPAECEDFEVRIAVVTDQHPRETAWRITNPIGEVVATSRPYLKREYSLYLDTTFCLPAGCYDFAITDPDGINSNAYGRGQYTITLGTDTLASGGTFAGTDLREFCLGQEPPECDYLDLSAFQPYGGNQDRGTATVSANGKQIRLEDNAWKSIFLEYNITPNTILEYEFKGGPMGEIHAIGLDDNNILSSLRSFRIGGSQNWGRNNYAVYPQEGAGWMRGRIPIGQFYTGPASELFFISDKDVPPHDNVSTFRNVRVHEGGCDNMTPRQPDNMTTRHRDFGAAAGAGKGTVAEQGQVRTFRSDTPTRWQLVDALGRTLYTDNAKRTTFRLDLGNVPTGIYFLAYNTDEGPAVDRVVVR